ncbi:MAG: zinc ribbon domain-containing protein [Lachnospiraceae bacterium]|nr:zinc ribbon domain-containing protein [Lachnospiraceae bacterium]
MYCPKCGKENEDGSRFCNNCGFELLKKYNTNNSGDKKNGYYLFTGFALITVIIILILVVQNAGEQINRELATPTSSSRTGYRTNSTSYNSYSHQEYLSEKDFEIREYKGRYQYYLIIKNNGTVTANIEGNLTSYDAKGNAVGAESGHLRCLGPQEEGVMEFYLIDMSNVDHVDYNLTYKANSGSSSLYQGLELTKQRNLNNVIVKITNNSNETKTIWAVQGFFFDKNGKLVYTNTEYDSGEIAPGTSHSVELRCFDEYDHVECYLKSLW